MYFWINYYYLYKRMPLVINKFNYFISVSTNLNAAGNYILENCVLLIDN